jgi:drug/metabolite transporter (DMT)-like permease
LDYFAGLDGTAQGRQLALYLAVLAAVLHAIFGALQKGRHDPWLTRGAIDFCYGAMALPVALFVVPWPEPGMWPIFAGAFVIHTTYKVFQAMAYVRGAFTVVYPVVRGTGPLVTVLAAGVVFSETFSPVQWGGVLFLTAGIFGLAGINLRAETIDRRLLIQTLGLAFFTGILVAGYTTFDAYGIRATPNPFTFLAWFFFFDGLVFPVIAVRHWRALQNPPLLGPLMQRGFIGAIVAFFSFGSIMLATRLDKVGEAAVMRETSTVFAALIGWLFLKEKVGLLRASLMALIALGAVFVEFGGQSV